MKLQRVSDTDDRWTQQPVQEISAETAADIRDKTSLHLPSVIRQFPLTTTEYDVK